VGAAACPAGYTCANPVGLGTHCYEIGCGDGAVDLATEDCDDANANEFDGCTSDCRQVRHDADTIQTFGLGAGKGDARKTRLGRTAAIAAEKDGTLYVSAAGTNVMFRLSGEEPRQAARVAGNGTMVGGVVTNARPDSVSTTFGVSLATDGFGNVYVGDVQDSVIHRIDAITGRVDTVGGTGITARSDDDDLPGTLIDLNLPLGLVADLDGTILFTEADTRPFGQQVARIRRFDPSDGHIRTVYSEPVRPTDDGEGFPGSIDDLVVDELGRLWAMSRFSEPRSVGGRTVIDAFVGFSQITLDPPGRVTTKIYSHSTDEQGARIDDPSTLPGIGNDQAHTATIDGNLFFVLMNDSLVRVALDQGTGEVVATLPPSIDGGGFLDLSEVDGGAIPFTLKPTDLVLVDNDLLADTDDLVDTDVLVADPGNGVVWSFPAGAKGLTPTARDVIAGELPTIIQTGDAVSTEIAVGFARETDGRVGVGSSADCGAVGLDAAAIEFLLAFPDLHRVAFSNCRSNVAILAGTGAPGDSGDGGRADAAQLDRPTAMVRIDLDGPTAAVDDFFFIADSGNNRIRRLRAVDAGGIFELVIDTFIGGASPTAPGAAAGLDLSRPSGLAVDDQRRLLIADTGHHRVVRVDVQTGSVDTVVGTGEPGFNGDDLAAIDTQLHEPVALVFLPLGLLSVVTNPGEPPPDPPPEGGLLLVTERGGHRIRGIFLPRAPPLPEVLTLAGDGTPGSVDATDDGTAGQLAFPRSLMFGIPNITERKLAFYIVDGIDRLRRMDFGFGLGLDDFGIKTSLSTLEGAGALSRLDGDRASASFRSPAALEALDDHRLLVLDRATGRVRLVDLEADAVVTVMGLPDGQPAPVVDIGGGGETDVALVAPLDDGAGLAIELDASPPVAWIGERGRLRRLTLTDPTDPTTWTTGTVVVPDLLRPEAIEVEDGVLFIADADAHVVWRLQPGSTTPDVVLGQRRARGASPPGTPAAASLLNGPAGLAVRDGVLVVADTGNHRVVRVDPVGPLAGPLALVIGDGTPSIGAEGRPARDFPVASPRGLAIDPVGNVVVAAGAALRLVGAGDATRCAGDTCPAHVASGAGDVVTIYGRSARARAFPEAVTRCLEDVALLPGQGPPRIVALDACTGLVLPLERTLSAR
jgi:cysteine-rich repeat protein